MKRDKKVTILKVICYGALSALSIRVIWRWWNVFYFYSKPGYLSRVTKEVVTIDDSWMQYYILAAGILIAAAGVIIAMILKLIRYPVPADWSGRSHNTKMQICGLLSLSGTFLYSKGMGEINREYAGISGWGGIYIKLDEYSWIPVFLFILCLAGYRMYLKKQKKGYAAILYGLMVLDAVLAGAALYLHNFLMAGQFFSAVALSLTVGVIYGLIEKNRGFFIETIPGGQTEEELYIRCFRSVNDQEADMEALALAIREVCGDLILEKEDIYRGIQKTLCNDAVIPESGEEWPQCFIIAGIKKEWRGECDDENSFAQRGAGTLGKTGERRQESDDLF